MGYPLQAIVKKLGVDKAIAYTVLGRLVQAGGGIISIIFIAKYLTKVEQGYYFTFGSLLAVQIFFELGLSSIITQFVAHEAAHLEWQREGFFEGSLETKSRLSSLLHFSFRWYLIVAVALIFVLVLLGYIFFNRYSKLGSDAAWHLPWIILCIATSGSLLMSPILAFLEGLGQVQEVARIRLVQQIVQLLLLFCFLIAGMKLLSSPLSAILTSTIAPLWVLVSSKRKMLRSIWGQLDKWKVNYKCEILPYQWRIGLSWISGYFIFQLFNPVIFATEGPVVAGQMGLTLAALTGILSLSLSWVNTKVPIFSSLIARRNYPQLDDLFNQTIKQASLICLACLSVFVLVVFTLQSWKTAIGSRFLPLGFVVLLCLATFANQWVNSLATYLRSHKKEPLLIASLVTAILTASSTLGLGKLFGVKGIITGYCFLTVILSPIWIYSIFVTKKKEWHS